MLRSPARTGPVSAVCHISIREEGIKTGNKQTTKKAPKSESGGCEEKSVTAGAVLYHPSCEPLLRQEPTVIFGSYYSVGFLYLYLFI